MRPPATPLKIHAAPATDAIEIVEFEGYLDRNTVCQAEAFIADLFRGRRSRLALAGMTSSTP